MDAALSPVDHSRWLFRLSAFLLIWFMAIFFHGCHVGGHDDDLLKLRSTDQFLLTKGQ
jgi:hypothetical protein